jgi:flagellar FliJ protein
MSETFRLAQLLDLARRNEEAKAIALSTLDAERRHGEAALAQLQAREAAQLASLAEARAGGLDPVQAVAARHYLASLERLIEEQRQQLDAVCAQLEEAREALLAATRERRLLERMEERFDDRVAAETSRRERVTADELAGQRFQRLRRGRSA